MDENDGMKSGNSCCEDHRRYGWDDCDEEREWKGQGHYMTLQRYLNHQYGKKGIDVAFGVIWADVDRSRSAIGEAIREPQLRHGGK